MRLSVILCAADGAFEVLKFVLWIIPCGVTLIDDWRVTSLARTASTRVDGFAAAKRARKANAATGINAIKVCRL